MEAEGPQEAVWYSAGLSQQGTGVRVKGEEIEDILGCFVKLPPSPTSSRFSLFFPFSPRLE